MTKPATRNNNSMADENKLKMSIEQMLNSDKTDRARVGVGEMFVGRAPKVITTILGSCVGIVMHDPETKIGGIAHVMLDQAKDREGNPAKFADTAVPELLKQMRAKGATRARIISKIFGGAEMFNFNKSHFFASIGRKNIDVVKEYLAKEGIPLVAEETGGKQGRSIEFSTETGMVAVRVNGAIIKTL